jgi:hypothetical protein
VGDTGGWADSRCFADSQAAYKAGDGGRAHDLSQEGKRHQAKQDQLDDKAAEWIFRGESREGGGGGVRTVCGQHALRPVPLYPGLRRHTPRPAVGTGRAWKVVSKWRTLLVASGSRVDQATQRPAAMVVTCPRGTLDMSHAVRASPTLHERPRSSGEAVPCAGYWLRGCG